MNGIKDNVYVTSVVELENKSGYSLEFSTGEKVEIFHGKNGENGSTPSINIIKENGNYYWSVNGVILKDETGNNIPVGGSNESPSLKTGYQLESDNVEGTWNKESMIPHGQKSQLELPIRFLLLSKLRKTIRLSILPCLMVPLFLCQ